MNNQSVIIKYDLENMPITYDCAFYLSNAVLMLKHLGFDKFSVWVCDLNFRERSARDLKMSIEEKKWRVENLVAPICRRLIGCEGIVISGEYAAPSGCSIFPDHFVGKMVGYNAAVTGRLYNLTNMSPLQFDSSKWAKQKIKSWIGLDGGRCMSITMRQSNHFVHRNTDLNVIPELASYLERSGKILIVVPDSDNDQSKRLDFHNVEVAYHASLSLDLRLALYQHCYINIGPSNGPVAMSFLTRNVKMLQFDLLKSDHTGIGVNQGWHASNGFPVGENFPWAENGSRLCWDDLNFSNIKRCLEADGNSVQ